jgi:hypothetical protein
MQAHSSAKGRRKKKDDTEKEKKKKNGTIHAIREISSTQ